MDQPTSKEPRGPVSLRIKFRSASLDQFIERYAVDVSRGGIFIRTREPLPVGTQLRFDFQLQDAAPLLAGEGTIVWIRENDPARAGVTPGMGVRFDKLTPASQPVLEKILAEKARASRRARPRSPAPRAAWPCGGRRARSRRSIPAAARARRAGRERPAARRRSVAARRAAARPAPRPAGGRAAARRRARDGLELHGDRCAAAHDGARRRLRSVRHGPRPASTPRAGETATPAGVPTLESSGAFGRPRSTTGMNAQRSAPAPSALFEKPTADDIDRALSVLTEVDGPGPTPVPTPVDFSSRVRRPTDAQPVVLESAPDVGDAPKAAHGAHDAQPWSSSRRPTSATRPRGPPGTRRSSLGAATGERSATVPVDARSATSRTSRCTTTTKKTTRRPRGWARARRAWAAPSPSCRPRPPGRPRRLRRRNLRRSAARRRRREDHRRRGGRRRRSARARRRCRRTRSALDAPARRRGAERGAARDGSRARGQPPLQEEGLGRRRWRSSSSCCSRRRRCVLVRHQEAPARSPSPERRPRRLQPRPRPPRPRPHRRPRAQAAPRKPRRDAGAPQRRGEPAKTEPAETPGGTATPGTLRLRPEGETPEARRDRAASEAKPSPKREGRGQAPQEAPRGRARPPAAEAAPAVADAHPRPRRPPGAPSGEAAKPASSGHVLKITFVARGRRGDRRRHVDGHDAVLERRRRSGAAPLRHDQEGRLRVLRAHDRRLRLAARQERRAHAQAERQAARHGRRRAARSAEPEAPAEPPPGLGTTPASPKRE